MTAHLQSHWAAWKQICIGPNHNHFGTISYGQKETKEVVWLVKRSISADASHNVEQDEVIAVIVSTMKSMQEHTTGKHETVCLTAKVWYHYIYFRIAET